ncbi:hypothetical protein Y1Q_0009754 [Alligator mississippiensis]|uniref:Uncharacterized protein n=1 Tax=Alligator mississippiensis TaxID=8496 RepID=A0A151MWN5_ALLMI|nr:hypothetical protein Y1Q_0009754 [Alligator mississippiensis]
MAVWTLELIQSLCRLKMSLSKWYLIRVPRLLSWKTSDSMAENTMLKRIERRTENVRCSCVIPQSAAANLKGRITSSSQPTVHLLISRPEEATVIIYFILLQNTDWTTSPSHFSIRPIIGVAKTAAFCKAQASEMATDWKKTENVSFIIVG